MNIFSYPGNILVMVRLTVPVNNIYIILIVDFFKYFIFNYLHFF